MIVFLAFVALFTFCWTLFVHTMVVSAVTLYSCRAQVTLDRRSDAVNVKVSWQLAFNLCRTLVPQREGAAPFKQPIQLGGCIQAFHTYLMTIGIS